MSWRPLVKPWGASNRSGLRSAWRPGAPRGCAPPGSEWSVAHGADAPTGSIPGPASGPVEA
eukprot:15462086-Alexandrium_andersonii.AAC.1